MGLRPLFDDMCARLAAEHGWVGVRPRAVPRPEDLDIPARMALDGAARRRRRSGPTSLAAADATGVRARSAVIGLLHGRHAHVQGRGQRSLRPGGGVLRDDPGAGRLGGLAGRAHRRAGLARPVPDPRRSSAASTRTRPTPTWPTPRPSGVRGRPLRGGRPRLRARRRRAPPTAPTTRPTPGAAPSPSSPPDPTGPLSLTRARCANRRARAQVAADDGFVRGGVSSRRGRGCRSPAGA